MGQLNNTIEDKDKLLQKYIEDKEKKIIEIGKMQLKMKLS